MIELPSHPGYTLRELSPSEFEEMWYRESPNIFGDKPRLHLEAVLSAEEIARIKELRARQGQTIVLRYGLYFGDDLVGWHSGGQKSELEYYMRNSAIFPAHRRKGLYTALVRHVIEHVTDLGFQTITSRHTAVNNAVIIPKLKAGFVITGLELSDIFGTLVNLTYFANPGRRRVLSFRAGEEKADDEMKGWLGL